MTDISFETGSAKFNYRVAAIIERDQHYLLATVPSVDYWFLPGGRVQMGESSEQALTREVQEELGVTLLDWPLVVVRK